MLFASSEGERLDDPGIGLAALSELLEGQTVVVVLVHLVEDLVDSFLGRVLVLGRLLPLGNNGQNERLNIRDHRKNRFDEEFLEHNFIEAENFKFAGKDAGNVLFKVVILYVRNKEKYQKIS